MYDVTQPIKARLSNWELEESQIKSGSIPRGVVSLGVAFEGEITYDYYHRDGYASVNRTTYLSKWFEYFKENKHKYYLCKSLHPRISIYAPISVPRAILLEYMVLSGVVDIETQLLALDPHVSNEIVMSADVRRTLNGLNYENSTNMVLDFDHKLMIGRILTRLSANPYSPLAISPLEGLIEKRVNYHLVLVPFTKEQGNTLLFCKFSSHLLDMLSNQSKKTMFGM